MANKSYWIRKAGEYKAQRDELLEACKQAVAAFHLDSDMEEDFADEIKLLDAAIAKAEGRAQ